MKLLSFTSSARFPVAAACLALILATRMADADIIRVPEDFPRVSEALAAAASGDSVLIGLGMFFEQPGPTTIADVRPGVVVKGSGWNTSPSISNSSLIARLVIRFPPGNEPAELRDVLMSGHGVVIRNPHARVVHCRFGVGDPSQDDTGVAYFESGGTFDSCMVQMDIGTWGTPMTVFTVQGGDVHIRNNVIDVIHADWLLRAWDASSIEVRDNTFHGYAMQMEFGPGGFGPITIVNNIMVNGTFRCNGATPVIQYNVFPDTGGSGPGCPPADPTNLFVDPLMCDAHWLGDVDDFALNSASPCIGGGVGGTTIGALGIACGAQLSVDEELASPATVLRLDVTPNPVRSRTEFRVVGATNQPVLEVFNAAGRTVDFLQPGRAPYIWEPSSSVRPGVYFVRLRAQEGSATSKFVVLPR